MGPVNKLGYKIDFTRTLGREIDLLIDNKTLLDLLADSINENWIEKNDAVVITKELKKSIKSPGEYTILTCAHCKMVEDILLQKFKVTHEDDIIVWKIKPPGADVYYDVYVELEFKFHKPQYEEVVNKMIEAKMTN